MLHTPNQWRGLRESKNKVHPQTNNTNKKLLNHSSIQQLNHPTYYSKWPEQSKPHVSPPEVKLPVNSSPPRVHVMPHPMPEVSGSLIVTVLELSPFVRSVVTKRALNYYSASFPSSVWYVRLPRILRVIYVSRVLPCWRCKRLVFGIFMY